MPGQKSKAKRVSSLGETPAEARARMQSATSPPDASGGVALAPPPGVPLVVSEEIEGFGGGPAPDNIVEERAGDEAAPTPSKAMDMIRQLGQDKVQLQTELDAALNLVECYKAVHGELD